ncbi:hypothetical protein ACFL96_07450 [Thermoproteota archaeon]
MFNSKAVRRLIKGWKRDVLSEACLECGGSCCGLKLTKLSRKEALCITGGDLEMKNAGGGPLLERKMFQYSTRYLQDIDTCPQLVDGRCCVYDHEDKPDICSTFPFVIIPVQKTVYVTERDCPGVEYERIKDLEDRLADLGYMTL